VGTISSVSVEDNVSSTCCAVLVTVEVNVGLLRSFVLSVVTDEILSSTPLTENGVLIGICSTVSLLKPLRSTTGYDVTPTVELREVSETRECPFETSFTRRDVYVVKDDARDVSTTVFAVVAADVACNISTLAVVADMSADVVVVPFLPDVNADII